MTQEKTKIWPIVTVALIVLLPVFYVLSIGPAVIIYDRTSSDAVEDMIEFVYAPLVWFIETNTAFGRILEAYINLFE